MTSRLRSDRPQKAAAMDLTPLAGLTMSATEPPEHAMSVTDRSPLTHPDPDRLRNRAIMAACALITVGALTGTALLLTSNSTKEAEAINYFAVAGLAVAVPGVTV